MEADGQPRWSGRREKEWFEFPIKVLESRIVGEEDVLDIREPFFHFRAVEQLLAHLDECANDKDAHQDGSCAIQDICGHNRTMFSKDKRKLPASTMSWNSHDLRLDTKST